MRIYESTILTLYLADHSILTDYWSVVDFCEPESESAENLQAEIFLSMLITNIALTCPYAEWLIDYWLVIDLLWADIQSIKSAENLQGPVSEDVDFKYKICLIL